MLAKLWLNWYFKIALGGSILYIPRKQTIFCLLSSIIKLMLLLWHLMHLLHRACCDFPSPSSCLDEMISRCHDNSLRLYAFTKVNFKQIENEIEFFFSSFSLSFWFNHAFTHSYYSSKVLIWTSCIIVVERFKPKRCLLIFFSPSFACTWKRRQRSAEHSHCIVCNFKVN